MWLQAKCGSLGLSRLRCAARPPSATFQPTLLLLLADRRLTESVEYDERIQITMARKRRRSNSQRRRPARNRNTGGERRAASAAQSQQSQTGAEASSSGLESSVPRESAALSSRAPADSQSGQLGSTRSQETPAGARTAWPTRRKRSQLVELPVQELDHVRSDLARIGLLSLGMVLVLVVLTFVLR